MAPLLRILVSSALVLLLWQPAAAAEPTEQEKGEAREHYRRGNEAYAERDYEAALRAFQKADSIMAVPTTGLGLAKSESHTGLLVEACATLQRVVRFPETPDEPESFTLARDEARSLLASLTERTPTVKVRVSGVTDDDAVVVTVDGTRIAWAPHAPHDVQPVNPGEHEMTVSAAGYEEERVTFAVAEREQRLLKVTLASSPRMPSEAPESGATDSWEPTLPMMATGFGLSVVALAMGTVSGALSLAATDELDDKCGGQPCPERLRAEHEDAIQLANVSNVSFAVAGVGAIIGVVGLLLHLTKDTPTTARHHGLTIHF